MARMSNRYLRRSLSAIRKGGPPICTTTTLDRHRYFTAHDTSVGSGPSCPESGPSLTPQSLHLLDQEVQGSAGLNRHVAGDGTIRHEGGVIAIKILDIYLENLCVGMAKRLPYWLLAGS